MLTFYISCRPLKYGNELLMPDEQLKHGFVDLDIQHKLIGMNREIDGRALYEVTIGANSSYSDQNCLDYQAIIIEGMAAYSCHLKSLQSAQALAQQLTELTFNIVGDKIIPVIPARLLE